MDLPANLCLNTISREISGRNTSEFQRRHHVTPDLVQRIGLEAELEGHSGCVNCLEWNESGSLLASGSDDMQVVLWDPHRHRRITTLKTHHTGNIFSVKFLPDCGDSLIVSGAADARICVHDVTSGETRHTFSCHASRVKRLATAPGTPFLFWSAAEDGTLMQFDLRCPELSSDQHPKNVLLNLKAYAGAAAELKCLSVNPARPELLAVGANDPYVRVYDRRMLSCQEIKFPSFDASLRSPWERENLLEQLTRDEDFCIPENAATYYVPGHLPHKAWEYARRYRQLAATYVTFSADGRDLLVNLGGEQVYLFDVNGAHRPHSLALLAPRQPATDTAKGVTLSSNGLHPPNGTNGVTAGHGGVNGVTNGHVSNGHVVASLATNQCGAAKKTGKHKKSMGPRAESLKQQANTAYEQQQYTKAIELYNEALYAAPHSALLYANRAAALLKRGWDGDLYAALRDCYSAIKLDPTHIKAHFRLAKCLFELQWREEASECLLLFKAKFPDYAQSSACAHLEHDIQTAIDKENKSEKRESERRGGSERRSGPGGGGDEALRACEREWRGAARDYERRFCGHCNTTTDIKEANFFGSEGQYIVAGSDDGSFFIWERRTTNIVRVLRGDDSIVNCLQPHPTACLLATSGIDPVVRLWSPRPEDGAREERCVDNSSDAAAANQRRMNADPLEVILMNMGYSRFPGDLDATSPEDRTTTNRTGNVDCRPS